MADVVVTVPGWMWAEWCGEGDLPGDRPTGRRYQFSVPQRPKIEPGERVYVVAQGKLRGYAPLICVEPGRGRSCLLIRGGGAVAVTIPERIAGFQGFRYRWWPREQESAFPNWRQV